jgi:hypothetical protein
VFAAVVVSDGEGVVAVFCCSFSHQKLPLSAMLYIQREREIRERL